MDEHAGSARGPVHASRRPTGTDVVDTVLGAAALSVLAAGTVARPATAVLRPVVGVVLRPPLVPTVAQPATWLRAAARRGATLRQAAMSETVARLDAALPVVAARLEGHVDLTEIVQGHLDLAGIAQDLVTEVDLPEIIRGSSSAVVSETVLGVRLQGISADEALARAADRWRVRLSRGARTPPRPS